MHITPPAGSFDMAVTLKDVAHLAKVTPPVVSRVLHNKSTSGRVSAATAERVRQAAEQLGYRVNVMARNFRAQQTRTIGVLNGQGLITRPTFAITIPPGLSRSMASDQNSWVVR